MDTEPKDIPVRVAIRIRPMAAREEKEGCQECVEVISGTPQVILRNIDKAFTYDYAFPHSISQAEVYERSVSKLILQLFKGYNVTILAYGQTGSGKTYSMGTAHDSLKYKEAIGIIPRAVQDIFDESVHQTESDIIVRVSFVELYKECLYDLLSSKSREGALLDIREDPKEGIKMCGVTEIPVKSVEETMKLLELGAANRATGATAMNATSSRSHAIFSLHLEVMNKETNNLTTAKFHLVDLAGSERCKKTGATGERLKEGININKGLLALGNVISALGVEVSVKAHVPYRDSKLTRLLQDSLGGNSHTVMIACVSPADSNLEETLSTLRYADRARKIKNKPIVNRNPQEAELAKLKIQVQQLQVQLLASQPGGTSNATDEEIESLLKINSSLEVSNEQLTVALQSAINENVNMAEKALMAESAREKLKTKLNELIAQTGNTVDQFNKTFDVSTNPQYEEQVNLVKELQQTAIDLQVEQNKNQKMMIDHEIARHTNCEEKDTEGKEGSEGEKEGESPIEDEFGTSFTLRQAKMNEQLLDLNRILAMKEDLREKMSTNDTTYVLMKKKYESNLKDSEDQINILLKEKDALQQQIKSSTQTVATNNLTDFVTNSPSVHAISSLFENRISEQRRKRLQELEQNITNLKKKIMEQNKMLKLKDQSEQKVIKLNNEIFNMKSVRVKLMKQVKEDGEKFRKWKAQKDREFAKLKEQDRKKQFQMVKMERLHNKQQNVLKRKMEEAVAINKRLKDVMALQKDCQDKRHASKDIGSVQSRMKTWLKGEIDLVTVRNEAKKSLPNLVEDRKRISDKIEKVKENLDSDFITSDYRQILESRQQSLKNDLQMRSAQISDLQSKIVGADQEFDGKKRFESLQSMLEAKFAAQFLFDVATENSTAVKSRESQLEELTNQYEETCQEMEEITGELSKLKEDHQKEVNKLAREQEDKVILLLGQMPKSSEQGNYTTCDPELLKRLKIQEDELEKLSRLHELLQQKTEECDGLNKDILDLKFIKETDMKFKKPVIVKEKKNLMELEMYESSEDEDEDDNENVDPDWRGTPLFKRIRQITTKKSSSASKESKEFLSIDFSLDNNSGSKRDSSGQVKCGCSKDCSSKICKCRKSGAICTISCKCNALKCTNHKKNSSSGEKKPEVDLNSTFEIPTRPLAVIENQSKRMRLSKPKLATGNETFNPFKSGKSFTEFDTDF